MKHIICTIAIALGAGLSSEAALLINSETKDPTGKLLHKGTIEIQGRSLKMTQTGRQEYQIFHGDRNKMYMVDPATRSYMVFDKQTMQAIGTQVSTAMADMNSQMAKAMEGMTDKQKEALAKYMPKAQAPARGGGGVQVKKTTDRRTINTYPCVRYDVWHGSEKNTEMWVTPWSKVKHGKTAYAAYMDMAHFMEDMIKAMSDNPTVSGMANSVSGMAQVDGFPILIRHFSGGRVERETTFTSFIKGGGTGGIDVPGNFKQRQLLSGMGR